MEHRDYKSARHSSLDVFLAPNGNHKNIYMFCHQISINFNAIFMFPTIPAKVCFPLKGLLCPYFVNTLLYNLLDQILQKPLSGEYNSEYKI